MTITIHTLKIYPYCGKSSTKFIFSTHKLRAMCCHHHQVSHRNNLLFLAFFSLHLIVGIVVVVSLPECYGCARRFHNSFSSHPEYAISFFICTTIAIRYQSGGLLLALSRHLTRNFVWKKNPTRRCSLSLSRQAFYCSFSICCQLKADLVRI